MSSTSGGSGHKPNTSTSKIKVNFLKNGQSSDWIIVQEKHYKSTKNMSSPPVSLNLQSIIDNRPQLLPPGTHLEIDDLIVGSPTNANVVSVSADKSSDDMELDISSSAGHNTITDLASIDD